MAEIEKSIQEGFREIVLSGIHLGLYGTESAKLNLSNLLKLILRNLKMSRVRLSSIEISEVNDDIISLL